MRRKQSTLEERLTECECCKYPVSQKHHLLTVSEYGDNDCTVQLCANCHELFHLFYEARKHKIPEVGKGRFWTKKDDRVLAKHFSKRSTRIQSLILQKSQYRNIYNYIESLVDLALECESISTQNAIEYMEERWERQRRDDMQMLEVYERLYKENDLHGRDNENWDALKKKYSIDTPCAV